MGNGTWNYYETSCCIMSNFAVGVIEDHAAFESIVSLYAMERSGLIKP
jgi:hypothetical protein